MNERPALEHASFGLSSLLVRVEDWPRTVLFARALRLRTGTVYLGPDCLLMLSASP